MNSIFNKSAFLFLLGSFLMIGCNSSQPSLKNGNEKQPNSNTAGEDPDETAITGKYWKLVKLEGQKVKMGKNQEREVHLILKTEENRVSGFAGCNTFNGSYTLEKGNRVRFKNIATTMKLCPDVEVDEQAFLKVLELTDNYTIHNDTLSLNVGRRAPLAVFEAVYF